MTDLTCKSCWHRHSPLDNATHCAKCGESLAGVVYGELILPEDTHQTALATISSKPDNSILLDPAAKGSIKARLLAYYYHMDKQGLAWHTPDVQGWVNALQAEGKTPATVKAYVSTVKSHHIGGKKKKGFLQKPHGKQALADVVQAGVFNAFSLSDETISKMSELEIQNYKMNLNTQLDTAQRAKLAEITAAFENVEIKAETKVQDKTDDQFLRLTDSQCVALLESVNSRTVKGIRDRAIIALLLATGIRAQELTHITVSDVEAQKEGIASLLVRQGKGNKQRTIPYGDMAGLLGFVVQWVNHLKLVIVDHAKDQGIAESGVDWSSVPLFVSLSKDGKSVHWQAKDSDRKGYLAGARLSVRSIERILAEYPVLVGGKLRHVKPHDMRRTYAKLQYNAGLPIASIQANLGHAKIETTLGYIGDVDYDQRQGRKMFDFSGLLKDNPFQGSFNGKLTQALAN